jgi:hypothetical protein
LLCQRLFRRTGCAHTRIYHRLNLYHLPSGLNPYSRFLQSAQVFRTVYIALFTGFICLYPDK